MQPTRTLGRRAVAPARILVSPQRALVDSPVSVRGEGLPPEALLTLRSRVADESGNAWESWAVFRSDAEGGLDLGVDPSLEGTYTGLHPMGFIQSMRLPDDVPSGRYEQPKLEPATVLLQLERDGEQLATAELERIFVAPHVERSDVREGGLVGTYFRPTGSPPRGAVLVVGGSGGGLVDARAALLASRGYASLSLAYFLTEGLPDSLVEIPLEYFQTALRWMFAQGGCAPGRVAVMGTSRGGELALLLAATFPELSAVIGYVPSGVVYGGISDRTADDDPTPPGPAWTYQGKEFAAAYVDYDANDVSATPISFQPGFLKGLEDRAAAEAAAIPVERIQGPVLLFSGRDDRLWPSEELASIAERRLREHGSPHSVEHVAYDDAGHLIGHAYLPATIHSLVHPLRGDAIALGGTDAGDSFAQADSWQRVLRFLEDHFA